MLSRVLPDISSASEGDVNMAHMTVTMIIVYIYTCFLCHSHSLNKGCNFLGFFKFIEDFLHSLLFSINSRVLFISRFQWL